MFVGGKTHVMGSVVKERWLVDGLSECQYCHLFTMVVAGEGVSWEHICFC